MKNIKRSLLIIGLSVLFVLAGTYEVQACSCAGRSWDQSQNGNQTCGYYWSAEVVFVGVVEKIETDEEKSSVKVTFLVEKPIRGVSGKTIEIFTSLSGGMCGYPFEQGERYFVYGRKGQDGKLTEHLCGPTVKLKDAANDLEYAEDVAQRKLGTRFYGSVIQDKQGVEYSQQNNKRLSGIEVMIRSATNTFKTRTDENGVYLFKDFPKDVYHVSADLPDGVSEINPEAIRPNQFVNPCGQKVFRVSSKGSISGKVVGFPLSDIENVGGRDMPQPQLTLIPVDENGQSVKVTSSFGEAWAYRDKFEYSFRNIPAGKYILAMNPKNCPYPNNGIGTMYYPGVATFGEAKVITIKDGDNVALGDFRSLPALKERWITGKVVDRDGSPVANARVRITAGRLWSGECSGTYFEASSDEAGRFRIKGFETYRYSVGAYVDGSDGKIRGHAKEFQLPENLPVDELVLILDQR